MEYYAILIIAALVILIATLVFLGVKISTTPSTAAYPPVAYACPDYWNTDKDGNCIAGNRNVGGLHTGYVLQPVTITYPGLSATCAKQKWALDNNVIWSGITEYNLC